MTAHHSLPSRFCAEKQALSEDGFTLLETLVALSILSMSVVVLFGIFSGGLERAQDDARAGQARVLAQALLARARVEAPLASSQGLAFPNLVWQLHVQPQPTAALKTSMASEIVSASVRWMSGNEQKSLSLSTVMFTQESKGR